MQYICTLMDAAGMKVSFGNYCFDPLIGNLLEDIVFDALIYFKCKLCNDITKCGVNTSFLIEV